VIGDSSKSVVPAAPLLQLDKLTLRFRGLTAVDNVDLKVLPHAIFAVIGPNGAGKTSLFNAVTGINEPTSGTVTFEGQDLRRPMTGRLSIPIMVLGMAVRHIPTFTGRPGSLPA